MKKMQQLFVLLFLFNIVFYAQNNTVQKTQLTDTLKIAIISDPHYYSPSLGTTGKAFQTYLANDRKMIAESHELLTSAIAIIKNEKPNILLVSGDLTKDGEKINHQTFATFMKDIKNSGIKVFVVPGNHDVLNPQSYSYKDSTTTFIPNITAAEFAQIYSEFGYGDAVYRDPNSLSYIAEPVSGVWLFCMDACRYNENTTSAVTGGKFSASTLSWILDKLAEAKTKNKVVLGMMHHGVLEHYTGQKTLFTDYVIDDYKNVSNLFASNGMRFVFTGHYHAQDITRGTFTNGTDIYDIETGSLVTYPSPVRIVKVTPDVKLDIYSKFIDSINYNTNGKTFKQYAKDYLIAGMNDLAYAMLTAPVQYGGYGIDAATAQQLAPIIANAFTAHYSGDELPDAATLATIQNFIKSSDPATVMLGQSIGSLWTDLPPADNKTLILPNTTVPVELISFNAKSDGKNIKLTWSTATESNNKGFEIETKFGSENWSIVSFVNGNGTTAKISEYSYTDNPAVIGKYYYRLKQIDFDGSFNYSKVIEVNNSNLPSDYTLEQNYPNPFNPSTKISFSLPVKSRITIKITDLLGSSIATLKDEVMEAGSYDVNFDASKLSSGIYFYSLTSNAGSITKKMILTK